MVLSSLDFNLPSSIPAMDVALAVRLSADYEMRLRLAHISEETRRILQKGGVVDLTEQDRLIAFVLEKAQQERRILNSHAFIGRILSEHPPSADPDAEKIV